MQRNQYIISNKALEVEGNYTEFAFFGYNLYAYLPLKVSFHLDDERGILILGYAILYHKPKLNDQEVAEYLLENSSDFDSLLELAEDLSGRFVILYHDDGETYSFSDASGLRQIFYGEIKGCFCLSSSPKLILETFAIEPKISTEKKIFMTRPGFYKRANQWFGYDSVDDRLQKILPNHYLQVENRQVGRIPLRLPDIDNEKEIIAKAKEILDGTYIGLLDRFNLIQPVTAGIDSRFILGPSLKHKEKIKYYIFDRRNQQTDTDVQIALQLSDRYDFKLNVIRPEKPTQDFMEEYKKLFIMPRIEETANTNLYHHYKHNKDKNIANLNGGTLETVECFFGYTKFRISRKMLRVLLGFKKPDAYLMKQIDKILEDTKEVSEESGIPVLDLVYWEQRLGHWGARVCYEDDLAIEEIAPCNNRKLFLTLLKVNPKRRRKPKWLFFHKALDEFFGEKHDVPINPHVSNVKKYIKARTLLKYYIMIIMEFLKGNQ